MIETVGTAGVSIESANRYLLRRMFVVAHRHATADGDDADNNNNKAKYLLENTPFTILLTVLVGLFFMFFLLCTYQVFQVWFCKVCCGRSEDTRIGNGAMAVNSNGDTILYNDGIIFRFTGQQRRMILESIFSASAKAVTDQDVPVTPKKKKKKQRKNGVKTEEFDVEEAEEMPVDAIEIPCSMTIDTAFSNNINSNSEFENHDDSIPVDDNRDVPINHSDETSETSDLSTNSTTSLQATTATTNPKKSSIIASSETIAELTSPEQPDFIENTTKLKNQASGDQDDLFVHELDDAGCSECQNSQNDELNAKESDSKKRSEGEATNSCDLQKSLSDVSLMTDESSSLRIFTSRSAVGSIDHETLGLCDISILSGESAQNINDLNECNQQNETAGSKEFRNVFQRAAIPFDGEETKEEIQDANETTLTRLRTVYSNDALEDESDYTALSSLHLPIPLSSRRESFTTVASEYTYEDDSTIGEVCPICLCGYSKGDLLVASKHCIHTFHKDCILEWLEKHDECPICRVDMVTDSELNSAATSVVGKTRMYQHSQRATTRSQRVRALNVHRSTSHDSSLEGSGRNSMQAWREAPRIYPAFR